MTAIELLNQARRDVADANQLLTTPVEHMRDIHPLVIKVRDKLLSATCSVQQLERMAAGAQIPKVGE